MLPGCRNAAKVPEPWSDRPPTIMLARALLLGLLGSTSALVVAPLRATSPSSNVAVRMSHVSRRSAAAAAAALFFSQAAMMPAQADSLLGESGKCSKFSPVCGALPSLGAGADVTEVPAAAKLLTVKGLPTDPAARKAQEDASVQAALDRKLGGEADAVRKEQEAEERKERLAAEKAARKAAKAAKASQ